MPRRCVLIRELVRGGDSSWSELAQEAHLPARPLRDIDVGANERGHLLVTDYEPFFIDVRQAGEALLAIVGSRGHSQATVYSTWTARRTHTGQAAAEWLSSNLGEHEWWPNDVTWRLSGDDLRLLYVSDSDCRQLSLFAWGGNARECLDEVHAALTPLVLS